jgi:Tfp pilus assembly protein PilO
MERSDRNEKDDAQKAKLIFISLAVVVIIILAWSFISANNARKERDAARQEVEMLKQDSAKLEQLLKEQNVVIDDLKKKVQQLETKAKAKPVAKKKSTPTKTTTKKAPKSTKSK